MITEFLCPNCDTLLDLEDPHLSMTVECPVCFSLAMVSSLTPPELELTEAGVALPGYTPPRRKSEPRTRSAPASSAPAANPAGDYLCVPFSGMTKSGTPAPGRVLAEQLQTLLNDYERQGWVFQRIDTVRVFLKPGCLAGIFGAQVQAREYDIVIFKRQAG